MARKKHGRTVAFFGGMEVEITSAYVEWLDKAQAILQGDESAVPPAPTKAELSSDPFPPPVDWA